MQSVIRIVPKEEFIDLTHIRYNAYPFSVMSMEDKQAMTKQYEEALQKGFGSAFYGLYRQEKLIGSMKTYDFSMNLYGNQILMGGVGGVAVDLLHKKEKACKEMIQFFLQDYYDKGACLTALYAFNLPFYRRMGFGFGNKTSRYFLDTATLPFYSKKHLRFYQTGDDSRLKDCYQRYVEQHHGMVERSDFEWSGLLNKDALRIVVFEPSPGKIEGYLIFRFTMKGAVQYDLQVVEWVYENQEAFTTLVSFLQTQADQSPRIKLDTQDDDFHFLLNNPNNGELNQVRLHHQSSVSEVGIMYRIVNVKRYFEILQNHNFGGRNLKVCFNISDDFLAANNGKTVVYFEEGKAILQADDADFEVCVEMKVAEFSAWAMGVIGFRKLHQYGMVTVSDTAHLEAVNRLFDFAKKPICTTLF
ncbi:MAG: enhanced intracellular survival protein Eis [Chitinophagales bacterium]